MEKHPCRICSKCFPTGRSLGGHMRSHVISYAAELGGKKKTKKKKLSGKVGGCSTAGYGLRENPKKLWRVSDLGEDDPTSSSSSLKWKQCGECGKVFPSSKALFGHMRCHSSKICRQAEVKHEQGKEEEQEGCFSGQKFSQESISDNTDLQEQEQEEVAISLMMLSRDFSGCWASDSSDKHSIVFEEARGDFDDCEYLEEEDNSGDEPKRRRTLMNISAEFEKKSKTTTIVEEKGHCFNIACESNWGKTESKLETVGYQCTSCSRSFLSYQALGGHRASHKRIKPCCSQKPSSSFDGITHEPSSSFEVSHSCQSSKNRVHKCSVCEKTFSSGQALGGHKRSHLASNAGIHSPAVEVAAAAAANVPELIDLNFPAPMDEDFRNVKPWMTCDSNQHLVDFIAN